MKTKYIIVLKPLLPEGKYRKVGSIKLTSDDAIMLNRAYRTAGMKYRVVQPSFGNILCYYE